MSDEATAVTEPLSAAAHAAPPRAPRDRSRTLLAALLIPLVLVAAVGAVILWPSTEHRSISALGSLGDTVHGRVESVLVQQCQADTPDAGQCANVVVKLTTGPEVRQETVLSLPQGPGQVALHPGDNITVGRSDSGGSISYFFSDFQRGTGLTLIAAIFAIFVVLVARWRGIGALIGLVLTYLMVVYFIIPSVLDGNSPVFVALVGSALLVVAVLYIAHGFNARTTTALVGTLISLCAVGVLASVGVSISEVTGLSSEEVSYVQTFFTGVDIKGLLLGGMILGALGALNDMTVSQASAVWEIHDAQPTLSRRSLYTRGMRVGRDHISSTVYTLILAYTGAALPLLILFTLSERSFSSIVTTDIVAEEIVRAAVGGIGLVLSVPITTALAAIVVRGRRAEPIEIEEDAVVPAEIDDTPVSETHDVAVIDESEDWEDPVVVDIEKPIVEEDSAAEAQRKKEKRKVKHWWNRRKKVIFLERPMSRRERKFWDE